MAGGSPPDSPLSELMSDDDMADMTTPNRSSRPSIDTHLSHDPDMLMPPSKKRKTGGGHSGAGQSGSFSTFSTHDRAPSTITADHDSDVELSEDTEGSAPGSPSHDEFAMRAEQVSACQWDGCPVGDLGNSDDLIVHVQTDHIAPKRARYTCEWGECARKGTAHPSGYALKAHMRSHTKEKPFFCHLPASATNANPIDPLTGQPKKGPKLRLLNGSAKAAAAAASSASSVKDVPETSTPLLDPADPNYDPSPPNDNIQYIPARHPITGQPGFMITYPPDIHFSQFESEIPANQLKRLLRRQLHWAQRDSEGLRVEIERLEAMKREEWILKEKLLGGVMEAELSVASAEGRVSVGAEEGMKGDVLGEGELRWSRTPKWRERNRMSRAEDDGMESDDDSEDLDVEDVLEAANEEVNRDGGTDGSATAATTAVSAADREREDAMDEMAAIGALMGLSAGNV